MLLKPVFLLLGILLLIGLAMPAQANSKERDGWNWWLQVAESDGELLVSMPMPVGAGWCLAWNHSVEGFTVHDCYRNQAGRMVLERSHLPDFAAGLDHIPGRGRQISDGQGGYWIEDINEAVPDNRYRLRVGSLKVNHRLVSHGEPGLAQLTRLFEDAEQTRCVVLAPRMEARAETRTESSAEARMDAGAATVISLSNLAANQGVTVQLVASTSCYQRRS
ncbi:protein of unknown function [Vreelandella subglaciescola]|uniref:DUF1850 domain-containing protein n=1 Tax=Vreelandella subglaciescola TaxID=29571 RepID=A0A1M7FSI4_9GAMM|nr:protein of unknown function [Halomonas subglaciescola]